uniref:Uncharacterized protein n=1 Tax=Anguilla anguilla TaxID=7936 RepID=A0A0E9QB77_ANGAN
MVYCVVIFNVILCSSGG